MSTALLPRFVTIEEFDTLPDQDEHVYELYEGELIEVRFSETEYTASCKNVFTHYFRLLSGTPLMF